jgi:hypothetical protein
MSAFSARFLRNLAVVLLLAAACPAALFAGSMLGCVGRGFTSECALSAIAIAPATLFVAGMLAAVIASGWMGMLLAFVGIILGMITILALSFSVGRPVPLDPISAVIATLWFTLPVMFGYGVARLGARLLAPSSQE